MEITFEYQLLIIGLFVIIVLYIIDRYKSRIIDIFSSGQKNKTDSVKICPNCGSTNIGGDLSREMISWKGITRDRCRDCDFSSPSFLMIPKSQVHKYKKKIKNKSKQTKETLKMISSSKGIIVKSFVKDKKKD